MKNNKLFYGFALLFLAGVVFFLGSTISKKSMFSQHNSQSILQDSLAITGITTLNSGCNCDIVIIAADDERVVFYYDKKLYDNQSEVKNNELNIDFDSKKDHIISFNNNEGGIKIKVYTKGLKSISQEGIGEIVSSSLLNSDELKVKNDGVGSMDLMLNVNKLNVENSGVGSIALKGNTNNLILNNNGTGSIEANSLVSKSADVNNSGVGSVEVNATDSLSLNNSGVGGITYSGAAIITKTTSTGVGSIEKQ